MKKILALLLLMTVVVASSVFGAYESVKNIDINLVNQDPDPAIVGGIVEIRLSVENLGGVQASDVVLEFVPEYPFTLVSDPVQEIGTLSSYQTDDNAIIVKYKIKVDSDVSAGSYPIKLSYRENGGADITVNDIYIDVKSKESVEITDIDKTVLVPGKMTNLTFTLENVGDAPLRDVSFYFENPDGVILPVGGDNTKHISKIDVGDVVFVTYDVVADSDVDAGLYSLNLYMNYEDPISGETQTTSTIAGMYVGGGTDFDVSFSEKSTTETSFSIANIGSNPSYSVSVSIPKQTGWFVSGSNSVIIGNLNKGDYTVASFNLQSMAQKDTSSEELKRPMQISDDLIVEISYTDTMGNRLIVEKEVAISQQSMAVSSEDRTEMMKNRTGGFSKQNESFILKYRWYFVGAVLIVAVVLLKKRNHKLKPKK